MSNRTHNPNAGIVVLGIVGGIGSGKSSVARWLAARRKDLLLINGDEVGHEVLAQPGVRDAIAKRFGSSVLGGAGRVDRKALAKLVFGSQPEQQAARHDLERIVHPRIRDEIENRIAAANAAGMKGVLLDAAVLFEAGWNDLCHATVFVDVPRSERMRRLQEFRNWSEADLDLREASQDSLLIKQERAPYRIDNSGTLDDAGRQLEVLFDRIQAISIAKRTHS